MYATKRRRRNVKSIKSSSSRGDPAPKTNPSKRHRERLNAELDHLASLLPFEQNVISKLDKLSILRLAVSYLRTKSYFQASMHERYTQENHLLQRLQHRIHHSRHLYSEMGLTDSESVLQALNGFLFVVTCDGEVFFASHTVEQYLGFHQSDIIHQSVLELIHSEDREQFKLQLNWRSSLTSDTTDSTLDHILQPENNHLLQRCFTVRFRCLLDNTSGFITLEISGKIRVLHGQSLKGEDAPLALFALCCPFGPLPMHDLSTRDYTFKSKHKMDMSPVSMDPRGKLFFGYADRELMTKGGYDLVHTDDLSYYAAAHQELIKTGSSGLIAYRLLTKDYRWIWLQTSSKVIYKNSKPDFVICTHRHLTEDEGRDLARKRGTEFKLPYAIVDNDPSGFFNHLLPEDDLCKVKSSRNKRSKNQLREYLHTGRKRKTPYRELYHSLSAYTPYSNINGYGESGNVGEIKSDAFMYSYTGQNFSFDAEQYRFGYHAFSTGTVYPAPSGASVDTDKYANGYYIDTRHYPYSFQYHANNYSDLMAHAASKYKQNIAKYGYGTGYGLDLSSKNIPYELDAQQSSDINFQKYGSDYVACDKLSLVNGVLDPLVSGCFYGRSNLSNGNPLLNSSVATGSSNSCDNLLSCSVFHNSSSLYSGYQTEYPSVVDRYIQTTVDKESEKSTSDVSNSHSDDTTPPSAPRGHCTVIRRNSPAKLIADKVNHEVYPVNSCESYLSRSSWPSCNKSFANNNNDLTNGHSPVLQTASTFSQTNVCNGQDKDAVLSQTEPPSRTSLGMATSVIRMPSRSRCQLQPSSVCSSEPQSSTSMTLCGRTPDPLI